MMKQKGTFEEEDGGDIYDASKTRTGRDEFGLRKRGGGEDVIKHTEDSNTQEDEFMAHNPHVRGSMENSGIMFNIEGCCDAE